MRDRVKIHGTYPHDAFGKWRTVEQYLSLARVAKLVGVEVTEEEIEKHDNGDGWSDSVYLWLNKGFVLIGKPKVNGVGEEGYLGVACMEMLGSSPAVKDIEVGDQAVYLHDGSYSLIERVEK